MNNSYIQISQVQWKMQTFDLESCKRVANWLSRRIKILETDFSEFHKSLDDLGFSNRVVKVLHLNGIESLHQLMVATADWANFISLKGVGPVVAEEIRRKVYEFQNNYIFKENVDMRVV